MITEGIYHNPNTGQDEVRCIRCDASGYVINAPQLNFTFSVGALPANGSVATNVVSLGEEHNYTLLLARKIGVASAQETIEIQSSIDNVLWAPAAGAVNRLTAWDDAPSGTKYFIIQGRPIGRFVRIFYKNGDTAQTNLVIELTALAGV